MLKMYMIHLKKNLNLKVCFYQEESPKMLFPITRFITNSTGNIAVQCACQSPRVDITSIQPL